MPGRRSPAIRRQGRRLPITIVARTMTGPSPISSIQLRVVLCLARDDYAAVAVTRRLLDAALLAIGVSDGCRGDLSIALTEACSNAVRHADQCDEYQVTISAHDDQLVVEVADTGVGLTGDRIPAGLPALDVEGGRGLHVIRACTDRMELRAVRPHGLAIRMVKTLTWKPDRRTARTGAIARR
jgi:serine/threonine-protein kinase RsbW